MEAKTKQNSALPIRSSQTSDENGFSKQICSQPSQAKKELPQLNPSSPPLDCSLACSLV
ncbi:hypothetical protein CFIMG_003338RAa [Ceratocystis fimbriata CBS 114723]|uniref:Uncharacterized protein n=1 Tax=Ceratocystis fimbriata CBS 114723 TaxID=1035309 RepID=A0A2C5X8R0_9PEZI|nr:hypothetical protein CFIMG_003338RAa [Ceratocystis fimbriata CBS 114723]